MSIAVVTCGDWTGEGACAVPHAALRATKSFFASSRLRLQPRSARRSFCMRVGTWADDIFETMSQDRLEASLDIDRLPAVDVRRIIQEEGAPRAPPRAPEPGQSGPEVIMGSSRMKSGTAQKLVLNTISTAVMIRLGRVYSNLMIDMPATNEKLRNRAVRMVELAAGVLRPTAVQAIRDADGNVKLAAVIARRRISAAEARALLEAHGGRLRQGLEA